IEETMKDLRSVSRVAELLHNRQLQRGKKRGGHVLSNQRLILDIDEKLNRWLNMSSTCEKEKLRNLLGNRLEGTCDWIFKEEAFINWMQLKRRTKQQSETDGKLLWITGTPGNGKSILTAAIIDHLLSLQPRERGAVVYFFFDTKRNTM